MVKAIVVVLKPRITILMKKIIQVIEDRTLLLMIFREIL